MLTIKQTWTPRLPCYDQYSDPDYMQQNEINQSTVMRFNDLSQNRIMML